MLSRVRAFGSGAATGWFDVAAYAKPRIFDVMARRMERAVSAWRIGGDIEAGGFPIRNLFGWLCYFASAVPFVLFVIDMFLLFGLGQDSANIIAGNALIFAAVRVTAVLVKTMAFNAFMALNALPYTAYTDFLVYHLGVGRPM